MRDVASILTEIAKVLTDEKDAIAGVVLVAVRADREMPVVVADLDEETFSDVMAALRHLREAAWYASTYKGGVGLEEKRREEWDLLEGLRLRNAATEMTRLMDLEMRLPFVCDVERSYGPCGSRHKTARGLAQHQARSHT
jgi:hypothetical protein